MKQKKRSASALFQSGRTLHEQICLLDSEEQDSGLPGLLQRPDLNDFIRNGFPLRIMRDHKNAFSLLLQLSQMIHDRIPAGRNQTVCEIIGKDPFTGNKRESLNEKARQISQQWICLCEQDILSVSSGFKKSGSQEIRDIADPKRVENSTARLRQLLYGVL